MSGRKKAEAKKGVQRDKRGNKRESINFMGGAFPVIFLFWKNFKKKQNKDMFGKTTNYKRKTAFQETPGAGKGGKGNRGFC